MDALAKEIQLHWGVRMRLISFHGRTFTCMLHCPYIMILHFLCFLSCIASEQNKRAFLLFRHGSVLSCLRSVSYSELVGTRI